VAAYKTIGTDLVLLVDEAFRAREEAKLDFKLTAMQGAAEAASAALRTATMALCSYRCSTLPDAQAKMAALVGGALDIEETRAVFLSSKQDI
jgi:hypothetical protein